MEPQTLAFGVLGGGQLAQMMIQEEGRAGVTLTPWVNSPHEPAALVARQSVVGGPRIAGSALRDYVASLDVVIFENEFVDVAALAEGAPSTRFVPELACLGLLRDKLAQKRLLERLAIPTAPFVEVPGAADEETFAALDRGFGAEHGGALVLKWSLYGYDGKGTFFYRPDAETRGGARAFLDSALARGAAVFAEKRVNFAREVALVSVADARYDCIHFPLVVSEQQGGICHRVTGPAAKLGVDPELQRTAEAAAKKLARAVKLVGTFAIEFFVSTRADGSSELLVNEIAPRVHNSGHFSQDAASESQFLLHLRAAAGEALITPTCRPYFAMLNILGPVGLARTRARAELPASLRPADSALALHWYGKREIKAGRKLGHLNTTADTESEFHERLRQLEHERQRICEFLAKETE